MLFQPFFPKFGSIWHKITISENFKGRFHTWLQGFEYFPSNVVQQSSDTCFNCVLGNYVSITPLVKSVYDL